MKKIGLIIIVLIMIIPVLHSEVNIDKIAVINLEKIISTVYSGKSASIIEINKEKEELQKVLDDMKAKIMQWEQAKLKEKNEERKLAYQKKIDEYKKKYSDYYKTKNYQIQKKIDNIQGKFLKEIYDVVKKIALNQGYSIILDINSDNIFYYSIDVDLTDEVIKYFIKNYGADEEENESTE